MAEIFKTLKRTNPPGKCSANSGIYPASYPIPMNPLSLGKIHVFTPLTLFCPEGVFLELQLTASTPGISKVRL